MQPLVIARPASQVRAVGMVVSRAAASDRLSRLWELALGLMVAVFFASNVYDPRIAAPLFYLKWLTTIPVILLSWRELRCRRHAGVPAGPLVFLIFAAALSVLVSSRIATSLAVLASLGLALTTAFVVASVVRAARSERQLFDVVARVGRLVVVSAAGMWLLGLSLGRGDAARFSAWTDNPNTLALLLAPSLVVLAADILARRPGWAWRSLPFLVAGLLLTFATGSRAALFWLTASGLGFVVHRTGAGLGVLAGLVALVLGGLYSTELAGAVLGLLRRTSPELAADVLSGRSEVWRLALQLFAVRPLLGHGIGMSQELLAGFEWIFIESQGSHFHNSYLTVAVEMGCGGLLALAIALGLAVVGAIRGSNRSRRETMADWPLRALPSALAVGALAHAVFESWLLAAGNADMIMLWTCLLLLHAEAVARAPIAPGRVLRSSGPPPA